MSATRETAFSVPKLAPLIELDLTFSVLDSGCEIQFDSGYMSRGQRESGLGVSTLGRYVQTVTSGKDLRVQLRHAILKGDVHRRHC